MNEDLRCPHDGRLLMKSFDMPIEIASTGALIVGGVLEIKCPRCKRVTVFTVADENDHLTSNLNVV